MGLRAQGCGAGGEDARAAPGRGDGVPVAGGREDAERAAKVLEGAAEHSPDPGDPGEAEGVRRGSQNEDEGGPDGGRGDGTLSGVAVDEKPVEGAAVPGQAAAGDLGAAQADTDGAGRAEEAA